MIEVKATLTPRHAAEVKEKLLKLKPFIGRDSSPEYPMFLTNPFVCAAVFFETKVAGLNDYRKALDVLSTLLQPPHSLPFLGALVIRSQKEPQHSGYIQVIVSDNPIQFPDVFEMSSPFQCTDELYGILGTFGYGINFFAPFVFDFLASLKGTHAGGASSFYGLDFKNTTASRLFS